ncbi:MAG: Mov34/MPN/PAD-1 family protein [Candidatus Hodarchaeales archaeon]|jgi:proteasome lid subunit RPN8/RPN11
MVKNTKRDPPNIFEIFLRDLSLKYDPKDLTLTVKLPSFSNISFDSMNGLPPKLLNKHLPKYKISLQPEEKINLSLDNKKEKFDMNKESNIMDSDQTDLNQIYDLDPQSKPLRVKIHLKAYIRLALHALKYANVNISQKDWVEVIGLLTGYIENEDTPLACLIVTDAYPIGHGTNVNAQIQDPQSMVRVYQNASNTGSMILGWYHSHPGYTAFMSQTDYETQVRYQRLGSKNSQLTAPIALVIDPTEISNRSYGFKIFRLSKNLKTWEEPLFKVLNCPLENLNELINTLIPVAMNGQMFLEYDHDK